MFFLTKCVTFLTGKMVMVQGEFDFRFHHGEHVTSSPLSRCVGGEIKKSQPGICSEELS